MSASGGRSGGSSSKSFVVPGIIVLSILVLITIVALVVVLVGHFTGSDRSQASGTGSRLESGQSAGGDDASGELASDGGGQPTVVHRDTVAASLGNVLDDPAAHLGSVQADYNAGGPHQYAIGDLDGDGTSDMLVRLDGDDIAPVVGVRVDPATGDFQVSQDHLVEGAASAGGERIWLGWADAGGVYQRNGRSISPEATYTLYTLTGPTWTKGASTTQSSDPADYRKVEWKPLDDRSGLDAVAVGEAPTGEAPETPAEESGDAAIPELAPGMARFTGTVQIMSTSQVTGGQPAPNGEPESNRYAMLVLSSPTPVTATSGDGQRSRTETVSEIRLGAQEQYGSENFDAWPQYDGQNVTIDMSPSDLWWPSDPNLPLSVPRLKGAAQVYPS